MNSCFLLSRFYLHYALGPQITAIKSQNTPLSSSVHAVPLVWDAFLSLDTWQCLLVCHKLNHYFLLETSLHCAHKTSHVCSLTAWYLLTWLLPSTCDQPEGQDVPFILLSSTTLPDSRHGEYEMDGWVNTETHSKGEMPPKALGKIPGLPLKVERKKWQWHILHQ